MKNNKLIAMFLCVCMVLASLAAITVAAEGESLPFADGDEVVISCPGKGLEISTQVNEYNGKYRLDGVEDGGAVFTVDITDDGIYFICDGKYLTSGATGSNLTLEDTASEYSLWALEAATGGWYIKNVNAKYYEKPQYIEYYYAFTTYSLDTSKVDIYTFQFEVQENNEGPVAGTNLPENLSQCGAPYGDMSVLLDGYTGVGEVNTYNGFQDKLFGIANANFDETAYSFTVVFDEAKTFNTVSIYALDFHSGCVHNPADLAVVINGVEYDVAVGTNPGGISESVATLGEEVTANAVTVKAVMGESDQQWAPFNMFTEVAVSTVEVEEDDESYKETFTYVDGDKVGIIQQLGEEWADKPASDFWYLVEDGETTISIFVIVDDRAILPGVLNPENPKALTSGTKVRVWIDADPSDTTRTTLVDVALVDGEAKAIRVDAGMDAAVKAVIYDTQGKDYGFAIALDKAALGIDGEYGMVVSLEETGRTTMHDIKYDNVTGSGNIFAPWSTTEFYKIYGTVNDENSDVSDNNSDVSDNNSDVSGEVTPEMGDAGIYVVAAVMLVAMAGVAVVYRRRRA